MKVQKVKLSDVKVGDLLWEVSPYTPCRRYPKLVTKVTNTMVFSQAYKLMDDWHMVNCPEAVDRAVKYLGLKGVTTSGDAYNGSASIPIANNEHCFDLYPERKEKKTYKHRGVVRDIDHYLIDLADASLEYDFYIN